MRWNITVWIAPFSTEDGADKDRAAAGPQFVQREVTADNLPGALALATIFADGIKINPRVWIAEVQGVVKAVGQ